MNQPLSIIIKHWDNIAPVLSPPYNETDYQQKIVWLEELMDVMGDDDNHPLVGLADNLATLIEAYETKHYPIPDAPPADILRYLMEAQDLKQNDLPELGSQGVVSEILNGKRQLNLRQIKVLSERFGVSPETFIS